ncbi:MAG TPA: hypothetical protein VJG83_03300 [archaeon]|nr:hypothetical protein [archaeon]
MKPNPKRLGVLKYRAWAYKNQVGRAKAVLQKLNSARRVRGLPELTSENIANLSAGAVKTTRKELGHLPSADVERESKRIHARLVRKTPEGAAIHKATRQKYEKSEKGKATSKSAKEAYRQTAAYVQVQERYIKSEKFKQTRKKYLGKKRKGSMQKPISKKPKKATPRSYRKYATSFKGAQRSARRLQMQANAVADFYAHSTRPLSPDEEMMRKEEGFYAKFIDPQNEKVRGAVNSLPLHLTSPL